MSREDLEDIVLYAILGDLILLILLASVMIK